MSHESLVELFDTCKPLGQGVSSITFPSQDDAWVIKLALVHDIHTYSQSKRAFGWDAFKDYTLVAHCAYFDRCIQQSLSSANYLHAPKMLHMTYLPVRPETSRLAKKIPFEFLNNKWQDVCIQVAVYSRIQGKTLMQALEEDATSWSQDDWRSLLMYLGISIYYMQKAFGLVLYDSNLSNVMITTLDEPVYLAYEMVEGVDACLVTPRSRLVVKWMDTSSALLQRMFSPVEWRRANAYRLWFNSYVRKHYDKRAVCVPVSIVDWLNLMAGIKSFAKKQGWDMMHEYLSKICSETSRFAFALVYGKMDMTHDQVVETIKRDQGEHRGWTLPPSFYDVNPYVMQTIVSMMFSSMQGTKVQANVFVPLPTCSLVFEQVEHNLDSMMAFWSNSCVYLTARHTFSPTARMIEERLQKGDIVIPVFRRESLVANRLDDASIQALFALYSYQEHLIESK